MDEANYEEFKIQNYLINKQFNSKEQNLLYSLRSRCYDSKNNFRNMNKHNLKCIFGCNSIEDQRHTFMICQEIRSKINVPSIKYENIFGNIEEQKAVINIFSQIDDTRREMQDKLLLPGDAINARTRAHCNELCRRAICRGAKNLN